LYLTSFKTLSADFWKRISHPSGGHEHSVMPPDRHLGSYNLLTDTFSIISKHPE